MLFKGSKTIGTSSYKAEVPLMEKMEGIARRIQANMTAMEAWRYDQFEEYSLGVRTGLPREVLDKSAGDEAVIWRALLDTLPKDPSELPAEWNASPWTFKDDKSDYWGLYLEILKLRAELSDLLTKQRQYFTDTQPLDGIYDVHGGQSFNAFTTEDQTTYMVGLPSSCLELWMYLESDRFQNPVFRQFYSEKEVVLEELRNDENEPEYMMWTAFQGAAFNAHPYGRPVIGWMGDVRSTTRSDMEDFFWRYYTPNNCQITIVGDVDAEEVFKLAKKYFGKWKPGEPSPEVTIKEPEQTGERRVTVEFDAEPQLLIGYHIPAAPHPDSYAISILQSILSGGRTSRFWKNIFEKGLTGDAPRVYSGPADRYPNLLVIETAPKAPLPIEEVESAILNEIERLKNEPVSEWELERVKNRIRVSDLNRIASNQWLAFSLSYAFIRSGDWRSLTDDYNRRLEVTPEDIQRVARKYLTQQNRTVAVLVKKENQQTAVTEAGENQ